MATENDFNQSDMREFWITEIKDKIDQSCNTNKDIMDLIVKIDKIMGYNIKQLDDFEKLEQNTILSKGVSKESLDEFVDKQVEKYSIKPYKRHQRICITPKSKIYNTTSFTKMVESQKIVNPPIKTSRISKKLFNHLYSQDNSTIKKDSTQVPVGFLSLARVEHNPPVALKIEQTIIKNKEESIIKSTKSSTFNLETEGSQVVNSNIESIVKCYVINSK